MNLNFPFLEMLKNKKVSSRDTQLIQQIIYFFNEPHVRDYIMNLLLHELYPHTPFKYLGTLYVEQGKDMDKNDLYIRETGDSLQSVLQKAIVPKNAQHSQHPQHAMDYMFTLCLNYEGAKVHYVSFVYETKPPRLVSFDSGSNLYLVGERVIVPIVQTIFEHVGLIPGTESSKRHIGVCNKRYFLKKFGIQFSGDNPLYRSLPADAFCQSWSLFFFMEWVRHFNKTKTKSTNGNFVRAWCRIRPSEREWFILSAFFIPLLAYNPYLHKEFEKHYPQTHICHLMDYLLEDKWGVVRKTEKKK